MMLQAKTFSRRDLVVIFVAGLVFGMVFANGWATQAVVEGQKHYFVRVCATEKAKVAQKVRVEERAKIEQELSPF